jgi:hypothetical protein
MTNEELKIFDMIVSSIKNEDFINYELAYNLFVGNCSKLDVTLLEEYFEHCLEHLKYFPFKNSSSQLYSWVREINDTLFNLIKKDDFKTKMFCTVSLSNYNRYNNDKLIEFEIYLRNKTDNFYKSILCSNDEDDLQFTYHTLEIGRGTIIPDDVHTELVKITERLHKFSSNVLSNYDELNYWYKFLKFTSLLQKVLEKNTYDSKMKRKYFNECLDKVDSTNPNKLKSITLSNSNLTIFSYNKKNNTCSCRHGSQPFKNRNVDLLFNKCMYSIDYK